MPLSAAALTTPAAVFDELDLEDDGGVLRARVERYIEEASSLVASIIGNGRSVQLHHGAAIVSAVKGMDHPTIILPVRPLVSIAEVTVDGDVVDPDDYDIVNADAGFVDRASGSWPSRMELQAGVVTAGRLGTERTNITVTYAGGWVTPLQATAELPRTLPHAIEGAVQRLVTARWRGRGNDPRLASTSHQSSTYTFGGEPVPPEVMAALAPHIRIANA
ncbi:MAG TPA: hypothetical protein VGF99_15080 [Myxococcota bacterium]